eukprot:2325099-Rhodomonas_salina.2
MSRHRYPPTRMLRDARYWPSVCWHLTTRMLYATSGTDLAYAGICLRVCFAMSGTDLRVCYAMSGTDIAYGATRTLGVRLCVGERCPPPHCEIKCEKTQPQYSLYQECVFLYLISPCLVLRACPDLAYLCYLPTCLLFDVRYCLRACYAMSDTAYARAMRCPVLPTRMLCDVRHCLRACYAMPGTAYARAMRCPVQPTRVLCDVRYCLRACYAMSGTAYARAMRCPALPTRVLCDVRYRLRIRW